MPYTCNCAEQLLAAADQAHQDAQRTRAAGATRNADHGDDTANAYAKAAGWLRRRAREQQR